MKSHVVSCLVVILSAYGCQSITKETQPFDIQGHRGSRGLAPENTIPAFVLATKMGVTTLELDLVVSKDSLLVVSHEPYFSPDICLTASLESLPKDSLINIYQFPYREIVSYDCGSLRNLRFPDQVLEPASKPLLEDVVDEVEQVTKTIGRKPVLWNIELKTTQQTDSLFHPTPDVFSDLVYQLLHKKNVLDRVTIQSFDFRTLQYFHQKYPSIPLALLIENELHWRVNVDSLGFQPAIYSCHYPLLSQEVIRQIQSAGMQVKPWTVNEVPDIKEMIAWGVDGIITDYPNRVLNILNEK